MDNNEWEEIIKETVSDELRHKTLTRARLELEKSEKPFFISFRWLIPIVPGLALLILLYNKTTNQEEVESLAIHDDYFDQLIEMNPIDLSDIDSELIAELEFYENFDLLEEWDEPSES